MFFIWECNGFMLNIWVGDYGVQTCWAALQAFAGFNFVIGVGFGVVAKEIVGNNIEQGEMGEAWESVVMSFLSSWGFGFLMGLGYWGFAGVLPMVFSDDLGVRILLEGWVFWFGLITVFDIVLSLNRELIGVLDPGRAVECSDHLWPFKRRCD